MDVTYVEYNGINLGTIKSGGLEQHNEKDASGTDILFRVYKLNVQFIMALSLDEESTWGPVDLQKDLDGGDVIGTVARAYKRVANLLQVDRRALIVKKAGETIIDTSIQRPATNVQPPEDDGNGPIAGDLAVVQPLSNGTWLMTWSVSWKVAQRVDFQPGTEPMPLSIKYEQEQSWDERGYSTITTTGELRSTAPTFYGSDPAQTWATVDALRNLTLPTLVPGYRRRSRFRVSRDGMTLSFSFVDKQLDTCPPSSAFEADGEFGISGSGAVWHGDINVILKGKKGASKRAMIEQALAICLSRVTILAKDRGVNAAELWQTMFAKAHGGLIIRERLFDNQISVAMRFLIPPIKIVTKGIQTSTNDEIIYGVVKTFLSSPGTSVPAATAEAYYQVIRAAINASNGDWEKAKQRIKNGGIGYLRGLIGSIPGVGQAVNLVWTIIAAGNAADAALAEKKAKEAQVNSAIAATPTLSVPSLALEAFGSPMPGTSNYREDMDAGGVRGNDPGQPILLVAGFMRDPLVSLSEAVTNRGSGVRGPVIGGDSGAAPVASGDLVNQAQLFTDTVIGAATSAIGLYKTIGQPEASVGQSVNPFSPLATVLGQSQQTQTGWQIDGVDNSSMQVEIVDEAPSIVTDSLPIDEESYDAGAYSSYFCEIEYIVRGKSILLQSNQDGEVAEEVNVFGQDPAHVVIRYQAQRIGSPPVMPIANTETADTNLVRLSTVIGLPMVDYNADGSPLYTARAVMVYGVKDTSKLLIRPPVPPWVDADMSSFMGIITDNQLIEITNAN